MIKTIMLALLFSLSALGADYPPSSIKSQVGSKLLPKWNLQVPQNQVTNLGGIDALIETGNKNVLANPGFEAATSLTGWVVGNATPSIETTRTYSGKQALKLTTSAQTGELLRQTISGAAGTGAVNPAFALLQMTGTAYVWNQGFTGLQLCVGLWDGTSVFTDTQCQAIPVVTGYVRVPLAFLAISSLTTQSYGLRLKTTATETATAYIDDVELKPAEIGVGSPDTVAAQYTPTFTGFGTPTAVDCNWARAGAYLNWDCKWTSGTSSATTASVTLPAGLTSANTSLWQAGTCGYSATGTSPSVGAPFSVLASANTTLLNFGGRTGSNGSLTAVNGSTLVNSGEIMSCQGRVPIAGWTPQTAIATQNSNYDWRPYVPTFTGLGTVTIGAANDCQEKREGPDNLIRCKFTIGTPTGVEARMSLPYTIASTFSSIQYVAPAGSSASGTSIINALREPGVGYFTFGFSSGTTATLSKANGNAAFATGQVLSIDGRYPVAGWSENQNAPQLIGSVVAPSAVNTIRTESVIFGGSTIPSVCSSSPCTLYDGTGGVSSVTRSGTGTYVVSFSSAWSTSVPPCVFTGSNLANSQQTISVYQATSTSMTIYASNASTLADNVVSMVCVGKK